MTDLGDEPEHATPLTPEEREGLIPSHVVFCSELNELEQQNILAADVWAFARRRDPVSEPFGRSLHRRMFGDVWRWAGRYRTTAKNIGGDHWLIEPQLREAYDNARFWVENASYPPDEAAVRFHHALVWIHPFPNGNGRWSRLMADLLAVRLGAPRFSWGRSALRSADETRNAYVAALRAADAYDISALLAFARS